MLSKTPFKALKFWSKTVHWSINKVDSSTMVNPKESLQERHANFFEFYLEYGADLLPQTLR